MKAKIKVAGKKTINISEGLHSDIKRVVIDKKQSIEEFAENSLRKVVDQYNSKKK